MREPVKARILVVDQRNEGESMLANILSRQESFLVNVAHDWQHGLLASRESEADAILCDGSMPWPDVLQFCRSLRADPDCISTVFIVVGPPQAIDEKEEGLEAGVDDWIEKSVPASLIIGKIKAWLRTSVLYKEHRRNCESLQMKNDILQANFKELTTISVKILDTYLPGFNDRARTAKAIAEYISERLSLEGEEKKKIIVSALFHELGKVGLPQTIAEKDYHTLNIEEKEIYTHHPAIGSMIISSMTGFKDSAGAIYHQLENYDGSGIPDGLMGDEISVGARIIRAIVLQEELCRAGFTTEGIIGNVKSSLNKALDPLIAGHLINFLEERDKSLFVNKARRSLDELKVGMILAEDVYSSSGIKLLPKGVMLQQKMITILSERNFVDPIVGGIYIIRE
jgi:response regulator RpfG family c-di-GMP phosphodiesterase